MPGLFDFNQWNTNKPGTTTFIPVTDITEEYLNLLTLYCSSTYAFNIWDEKNNLEKKIKLNILSKDLESDFKKRLLTQQSSSDLKGFRKGKAPLDVIEKYYKFYS